MTTTSTQSALVGQVWKRLQGVGFTPDFGAEGSRLLVALYRKLAADGEPISAAAITAIAAEVDVPAEVATALIEGGGERDDDGALSGILGLSLNDDHPHRFLVGDRELRNWCALDPFLIMPAMTEDVRLESADPHTGELVRVTVTSEGIQTQEPADAVMSIVVPGPGSTDSVGAGSRTSQRPTTSPRTAGTALWMMFCQQVHFFGSRASAEQLFEDKDEEVYFLTLEEAFTLAGLVFAPLYAQR